MNHLELPKIPFNLDGASELYKNGLKDYLYQKLYKSILLPMQLWNYSILGYHPSNEEKKASKENGQTTMRGEWTLLDKILLADTYLNRIIDTGNKPLSSWFQTTKHIYRPVINLNEPLIYEE
jgi:hypothetical protein